MTFELIVSAARTCLGTPFRHQGRIAGVGLDCAGVVVEVAKAIGSNPIDVSGYGRVPVNGQLESVLDTQTDLERVLDISTRRAGDILLLRFSGEPQHLAVLTDNNTIVHSYEAVGKCCEHRLSSVWAARIVRVYRFVGVTQ